MAEALKQSDAGCDHEEPPTAAFLSSDKTLHVEIKHGLKLKVEGQPHPSVSYTYAVSPFTEKPVQIDWKIIVNNDDIVSEHIRCHALQPGDSIKELVSTFKKALAKAVVFINTQDNYTLSPELTEGMEQGCFPIVILMKSDGESLVAFLREHYEQNIHAEMTIEMQAAQIQQQWETAPLEDSTTQVKRRSRTGSETTGFQRFKQALGLNPKCGTELMYEVKRLMFSGNKELIAVSNDEARFIMVMSAFTSYEKQAKPDISHSDVTDVFKKLEQHFNECILTDLPLYLVLCYRLHIAYSLYICDELEDFITGCINKFETLEPKKVTSAISTFLERDEFKVSFLSIDTLQGFNASIFFLLENACSELAKVSYNIHRRMADLQKVQAQHDTQKPFCQGFVYSRMLWTSLSLKLHDKRTTSVTRSTVNLWQDNLLKYSSRIVLDINSVREVKRGLKLGRLLKLAPDVSFNYLRMTDFLVGGKNVRPLAHVEMYLHAVESYIPFEADLADFLANVRANYDLWIKDGNTLKVATASVEGTLLATLKEGIVFVDTMNNICSRRKVDPTLVESDSIKWVLLLLHLIDFTSDKAETYLKLFVFSRSKVLKSRKCRQEIKRYIRETTRDNLPRLTIHQFGTLFKSLKIYSASTVEKYLRQYVVQQDVRIDDPTWHSFINEVVVRFGGASHHFFLLDFLRSVAASYVTDERQKEFVLDLLQWNMPKLFAVKEGADEVTEKKDVEVARNFSIFLRNFINRNALKHSILIQLPDVLGSILEEGDHFQFLILSVLKQEVIPEFKVLQGVETAMYENFQLVLMEAVNTLCKELSWVTAPTMKQEFCWGLVASCCSKINISQDNLDWVHSYDKVLKQVGYVYNVYCSGRRLTGNQCIIIEQLPEEIAAHASEDVRRYFEWVKDIQMVLKKWQDTFIHQRVNYDEIMLYASNHSLLLSLGDTLCVNSLVCDAQDSQLLKTQFLREYESLNISLIKYIPDQPDLKWCTLPALLQEYGVSLPQQLQELISLYILFPGEIKPQHFEPPVNHVPPSTNGRFQPSHNVCVQLSRSMNLYRLEELNTKLDKFQCPIIGLLDMFVFFKLNKSVLFDKYLRVQIRHNNEKLQSLHPQSMMTSLPFSGIQFFSAPTPSLASVLPSSLKESGGEEEDLPIKIFIRSLESTRDLLSKVMCGDAKYSEIIAEGDLDLENLDITREFAVLVNYSHANKMSDTGLVGVQSMLELVQYSSHIRNINSVCTQYKLKCCIDDMTLAKLNELVGDLVCSQDARAKLTPNEALVKMQEVKATFGFMEKTNSKTLDLFAVIQESAIFYQFVREKRFYGDIGVSKFDQQYHLIANQLQYEEHNERLLRDLYTAFKLMVPFMDPHQDLRKLLSRVLALETHLPDGVQALETVNANMALIRQWFSRIEEMIDHLKVGKEKLMVEVEVLSQERDDLIQEKCLLKQENESLHQQVLSLHQESERLKLAMEESATAVIEPWKFSRHQVETKPGGMVGGGGWGSVSKGVLQVAVKQFYPTVLSPPNLARLKREVKMLASIRHPNLVQFIGVVFEEDKNVSTNPPYIITELLDTSLRAAYEQNQIPQGNFCSIFEDTARALDYLHQRHEPIIHRDVSSANVLLKRLPNGSWLAKVSDLGSANLAKVAFTRNEGAIIYCAPEAFTDESDTHSEHSLTPKVDVYSFGIMLCELATSTLPTKSAFPSLLDRVLHEWPRLHDLIAICIRHEPERRPSMERVLLALIELS